MYVNVFLLTLSHDVEYQQTSFNHLRELGEAAYIFPFQSAKQPTSFTLFSRSCRLSHLPAHRIWIQSLSLTLAMYYAENENICSFMLVHQSSGSWFCFCIVRQLHTFRCLTKLQNKLQVKTTMSEKYNKKSEKWCCCFFMCISLESRS